ncbi:autorepressor SdpR family transcription factor [soil metagenome]
MKDEVFKALADPTRRRILRELGDRERSAGEIAALFPMTGASMSHHFTVLKTAGLIEGRREGQQIFYRLNTTVTQDLIASILDLLTPKENP